jgi:endonuclease/exonuclease/phosphatase family metal-dependent hydrolase
MDNNTNSLNLPQPGELIINNDYLESNKDINKISSIKIIQWNIERGYKMDLIIKDLLKQNADILLLQEIDINCQRSNNINCLTILAEKLKMSYAYVSEFCELYDKVRKDKDQGGGVHGNAIFAKFPISKENTIVIKHKYQPVIWDKEGYSRKEPRKGDRYFISTMFKFNENIFVDVYSIHLEVFCGINGRIQQFSDVPFYTEQRRKSIGEKNKIIQLIGGDLNTMAHGVARFSPKYCGNDWMRIKTLGKSEGRW